MTSTTPTTRTAGVDLASQVDNTAACVIEWRDRSARIVELHDAFDDVGITRLLHSVAKVGLDVPFGWPISFVEALQQHSHDGTWPLDYRHGLSREFRYRQTDLWLQTLPLGDHGHLPAPLSVSTDRIAIPAMRAAALLGAITPRLALDGSAVAVEVYPAAALLRWGYPSRGYKGRTNAVPRRLLVEAFRQRNASWLHLEGEQFDRCCANDNLFDALIAALVARARLVGQTEPIPEGLLDAARREGWIAVPLPDSLDRLTPK